MIRNVLMSYYAATIVFLSLDYFFGINARLAFLDGNASIRYGYYLFCFACLAGMIWRPAWTMAIGAIESLITLVAIIIHMALRVMLITDDVLEPGQGYVTLPEIFNFMLAGGIAYFAWASAIAELGRQHRKRV